MPTQPAETFPPTHWSLIAAARDGTERDAAAALDALCRTYWQPLYAFARRRGVPQDNAADAVQGFLSDFIERGDLLRSNPQKGRFRSFLLTAFQNHLVSELRREQAQKRGGDITFVALDDMLREEAWHQKSEAGLGPEQAYDMRWAEETMRRALANVEESYRRGGKMEAFLALRPALLGELAEDVDAVARSLGITVGGVGAAVFRLRAKFREALRVEISQTVASKEELEDEVRYLIKLLAQ